MNLGDGLLFELENGKPRLILLSHGIAKNPAKLSIRPRAANILSSRQPSCVEDVQVEERLARQQAGKRREARAKAGAASVPCNSNAAGGDSSSLTSSKAHEHQKAVAKVKPDRHKHTSTVGSLRVSGRTGQNSRTQAGTGGRAELKDKLVSGDSGLKDNVVVLTSEKLQQILKTVQTSSSTQHPSDDCRTQGNSTEGSQSFTLTKGGGEEMKEEDTGGGGKREGDGTTGAFQDKDSRSSGSLFSWMEDRQSDSRSAIDAKKAQWKRDLDEQVALKQQRSAPSRLQAEDTERVSSVQSSINHKDQPAAIRSSLKLGEVTPMEEVLSAERREEQRRRWLEELDRQREDMTERRRREKQLQRQTEDHELWASHFDSLQTRPPVHAAAPSRSSERGDLDPSSSLSLLWEATSSCGAESAGRASVDTGSGQPSSFLRSMTALLDPAQIEERERRRLKQLEQQRAIEAQMEERRRQKEQEEERRRKEEEEEERRVMLEREMLQRQYELDTLRERQKPSHQAEEPKKSHDDETLKPDAFTGQMDLEEKLRTSVSPYKDSAVQTEAAQQLPPPQSAAPPTSRSRAGRTGKENICLPAAGAGDNPYDAFARTDRSRRDKKRPEWNTQRPSRRFVPASERYPAALQRNRQESRLKRQAELLALQERTCQSRTDPPAPPPEPPAAHTQTRTGTSTKVESVFRGQNISAAANSERGHSPLVPAVRHGVQSQQRCAPLPPALDFVPYVRTDEVFNLDPSEPADTPPPRTFTAPQSSASPPASSQRDFLLHPELLRKTHTHRQQEILRGLAQLRQGLLQKQKELEADLNPLLKCQDVERQSPSQL
ncbi:coiled-coil domain-containing protein 66 isoform X2 [Echeneis naucrates]|uniref:CCDC66 domain-containing protein n=1 Tax=Echeneis naucrates TaxID=173247 RepID=A0A665VNT1_ECHNA|nr:coiled-coil domain-containing protein 66 isoform X2 [Echeneis naucrates]